MSAGTNTPGAGEQNEAARRSARVVLVLEERAPDPAGRSLYRPPTAPG